MARSKTTKRALVASVCATLMCIAMLIGTTFAWFTDTASTSVNKIQSGTLDVTLEKATAWDTDGSVKTWATAENQILTFRTADNRAATSILWEPGCTYSLPELRISNNGNLALKYKIIISGIEGNAELNKVIDWTITNDADSTTTDLSTTEYKLNAKSGDTVDSDILTIKGHMQETAGNEYQDETIDGIAITVIATQDTVEYDSSSNNYDANAEYPVVAVTQVAVDNDKTTTAAASIKSVETIGDTTTPIATATIPSGVKTTATEGDTSIQLKLTIDEASVPANFTYDVTSQEAKTLEVNMEGLATDNTAPITVTMYVGTNLSGFKLYHNNTAMTSVANAESVSNDQEYYYDSTTGIVTMKTATFSPFTYVCDRHDVKIVTTQDELNAAITNSEITTVKLGAEWTGDMLVNGAKGITLDFNGYTVGGTMYVGCNEDDWGNKDYTGTPSTLTLKDSQGTGGVKTSNMTAIYLMNSSKLTIENGTYETTGYGYTGYSHTIYMTNCSLTVNGGYIHNNAAGGSYNKVIVCDYDKGEASITINGGKFEGTKDCTYTEPFRGFTTSGGSFSVIIEASSSTNTNVPVTINGGEFYSYTFCSYLAAVKGNVLVNNCTFVHDDSGKNYGNEVFDIDSGFTVTVKGGTFTVNGEAYTDPSWNK